MSDSLRIEQFRKMAADDPNNELGHFSLGRALLESGEVPEAAKSFQRVIALNPNICKGVSTARRRATRTRPARPSDRHIQDRHQHRRRARRSHAQGRDAPQARRTGRRNARASPKSFAQPRSAKGRSSAIVAARSSQRWHIRRSATPRKMIQENICADCWREWIGMGTKVINELRLPLSDPQATEGVRSAHDGVSESGVIRKSQITNRHESTRICTNWKVLVFDS